MHSEHASSLRKERVYYDIRLFRIDRVERRTKDHLVRYYISIIVFYNPACSVKPAILGGHNTVVLSWGQSFEVSFYTAKT